MIVDRDVDRYLHDLLPPSGGVLAEMAAYAEECRFPYIGPLVGQMLRMLAETVGARRVFECGSGFGYSAHWFAQAVGPAGRVWLTDLSKDHLDRARDYLHRAGLGSRCVYRRGDALRTLRRTKGPFDVILVDIDKEGYPDSLEVTVPKLRPGGLLITDNLLWSGRVADPDVRDEETEAIREYNRRIYAHPELSPVVLPLRDGVGVCYRR